MIDNFTKVLLAMSVLAMVTSYLAVHYEDSYIKVQEKTNEN